MPLMPTIPRGAVVSTDPASNSEVDRGSTVDYVVSLRPRARRRPPSRHPATVLVPDVRGFLEADAVNTLLDADLTPGDRSEAFDPAIAAGLVIGTDPAAASTEVDRGSRRRLRRLAGPRADADPRADPATVLVPDVHGLRRGGCPQPLLDADLTPGTRSDAFDATIPSGAVVSTDPASNSEVDRGQRRLRRLPRPRADADPRADPGHGARARRARLPRGRCHQHPARRRPDTR